MDVGDAIADAIRRRGPISFAAYMELALYGPGGYYERPPVGAEGDFVTSPHVHPVFADLLATAIRDLHATIGAPRPFQVAEVGAGDGTLARHLGPRLHDLDVRYVAIERSEGAREALEGIAGVAVAERLDGSPQVVLANELLDNLPFRRLRGTAAGTREVMVALRGGRLVEELAEPSTAPGMELADGEERVLPVGAFAFVEELGARLAHPGYALLIDYGGVGEPGYAPHGYRAHRPVDDLLDRPGTADITAGVDFGLIADRAERAGLVAFPTVTQRHALVALGFDRWIQGELGRQAALLDAREGVEAVRTWSGRSRAPILVDPSALGRLRWLVLATPGSPAPSWIR